MSGTGGTDPDAECREQGVRYCFTIDRPSDNSSGVIWVEPGIIRWRYEARPSPPGYWLHNPFGKPDFVIKDSEAREVLVIRRASFVPPLFDMIEASKAVGRISLRSILRNRYRIDLEGETSWTFRMPLFTVRFYGESNTGSQVWVVVGPSKMQWNLLMKPGIDSARLLSALAFIHSEWWNYS